jgi:hypothetical protein
VKIAPIRKKSPKKTVPNPLPASDPQPEGCFGVVSTENSIIEVPSQSYRQADFEFSILNYDPPHARETRAPQRYPE